MDKPGTLTIRPARQEDHDAVWRIFEPILREGETYALPRDISRDDALAYWFDPRWEVFVAERSGDVVGSYVLRTNQRGGGAHVANCGYITAQSARRQGIASALCTHSLERARERGYRAMQFNFVVSSNEAAVSAWKRMGFDVVGRIPLAFDHPRLGLVDALVMHRTL
jgi:ribosomal protein S18 acetylase RimI-like enzyme